jgi:hypothetical protein
MLIRDGLPPLSTVLLALVGFVLCVILNVLYNRLRAQGSLRHSSNVWGEVRINQGADPEQELARERHQWLQAGLTRLAQVRLRDHMPVILICGAVIALLFFALRVQGTA